MNWALVCAHVYAVYTCMCVEINLGAIQLVF